MGGSKSPFTPEMHKFLEEHALGTRTPELTKMLNEEFGTTFTEKKVWYYRKNHHLPVGLGPGIPKDQGSKTYPFEILEFIRENAPGMYNRDLAELVNKTFGTSYTPLQIKAFKKNHHMLSGLTGQFVKGQPSWCKGRKQEEWMSPEAIERTKATRFKKGDHPWNTAAVGAEVRRVYEDGRELTFIKVAMPDVWESKGRYIWEKEHGEIPEGHAVVFRDGDTNNFDIDNLDCVPVEVLGLANGRGYIKLGGAAGLDLAKLEVKLDKRIKERMKDEEHNA